VSAPLYLPSSKLGNVGTNSAPIATIVSTKKGAAFLKEILLGGVLSDIKLDILLIRFYESKNIKK